MDDPTTAESIFAALGGFGAGLQGQGAQYLAAQDKRKQTLMEMDEKRRQALLTDFRRTLLDVKAGEYGKATQRIQNRLSDLKALGADDVSDTAQLAQLSSEGRWDELETELQGFDDRAVSEGLLDAMPQDKYIGKEGANAIYQGKDGPYVKPIEGLDPAAIPNAAGVQEFDYLTEGLSPDEVEKARRIKLGLAPRAVAASPTVIDIGGVKYNYDPTTKETTLIDINGNTVTKESVGESEGYIAASKKAGEQAIKMSGEAIEQIPTVRKSIATIDEAITALKQGANTGVISDYIPSFKASTLLFKNAANKMGLDVVAGTTFGALSAGELKVAMETAVPPLDEPEMMFYLERKRKAQQKLADELEKAAIYLGIPGNTPAGFMEMRRNEARAGKDSEQKKANEDIPDSAPAKRVKFLGLEPVN